MGMSQASSDTDAIITAFQANFNNLVICSMTAMVAYEYVLTLNQEVTMIWRRRWNAVTWLFMANRYVLIALTIIVISPYTAKSCFLAGIILVDIAQLAQYLMFAVFSALRVFVIWDRSIPMTLLVLVLSLAPVVTNFYIDIKTTPVFIVDPVLGIVCSSNLNVSDSTDFDFALVARISLIIADILVLGLTWHKTFSHRMAAIRVGVHTPLSALLLRDGTVYFVALFALNVATALVNTVTPLQYASPLPQLTSVLTPILISRFLLNLRQLGEAENEIQSHFNSRFSIPGFRVPSLASFVGDMGADLDHGDMDDEVEDVINAPVEGSVSSVDIFTEQISGTYFSENVCDIQEIRRAVV